MTLDQTLLGLKEEVVCLHVPYTWKARMARIQSNPDIFFCMQILEKGGDIGEECAFLLLDSMNSRLQFLTCPHSL